jgi:hypothetical protein
MGGLGYQPAAVFSRQDRCTKEATIRYGPW